MVFVNLKNLTGVEVDPIENIFTNNVLLSPLSDQGYYFLKYLDKN